MMPDPERTVEGELRQVIAELAIVSHMSASKLGGSGRDSGESIGGRRPPGGIDRKGDKDHDWAMKSAEHFAKRLEKAHSERTLLVILAEARDALEAHRRQPPAKDPEVSSPQWKRWISESTESHGELARRFGVKRAYIQQVRKQYRVEEMA